MHVIGGTEPSSPTAPTGSRCVNARTKALSMIHCVAGSAARRPEHFARVLTAVKQANAAISIVPC